ncbi:hypothetical protein DFJ66_2724 [Saccharothrix variisporea]|uniref:Uncharacterized protein n=2 Tax=Saccharothrix variisporea TaxID=543527 RepID=A0A495X9F1_9PSEU|nr:hypothetical protein DFJ66_2724 [Saccharothrix variisporea]
MSVNTIDGGKPSATEKARVRTETEDKLWQAMLDKPDATAAELSTAAGIGKSTAPKILIRWLEAGLVTRMSGIADGGRRAADRWSIRAGDHSEPQDEPPAHAQVVAVEREDLKATDPEKPGRLAPGALRGLVEDYLREHTGEAIGPTGMSKALKRSSGAVANALERLVADGYAVRVTDKPKTYAIARTESDAAAMSK